MDLKEKSCTFLGFGIRGYRSFTSSDIALVGPFNKVHLITGQNNSGKSALTDFAYRVLPKLYLGPTFTGKDYPLSRRDLPQNPQQQSSFNMTMSLCFNRDSILSNIDSNLKYNGKPVKDRMKEVLSSELLSRGNEGACWVDFDLSAQTETSFRQDLILNEKFAMALAESFDTNFKDIALAIASRAGSNPQDNLGSIVKEIIPWDSIPLTVKVDAIRHITDDAKPNKRAIAGGEGLVKELRRLRMPTVEEQFLNQEKWSRFERFVRNVLNDPEAEVTTDGEATAVLVKSGTPGFLELPDLGTGIEELVMLGAVVACNDNKLIIVEEPEIHLHPTLQSKMIQYFLDNDNGNRFLITTHSPTIINTPRVTVTQVTKNQGISKASQVRGVVDARNALDNIGAKPSDLLQTNYVIWVEGPSDRIYINYWLSEVAHDLNEGVHYSVMIYGGKLLNACSAEAADSENDFISLFRINTHFCVLIDSDRSKKGAKLNTTKRRIREECQSSGNISWVTDGRTIENYIPAPILRKALKDIYPNNTYDWDLGNNYVCPLGGTFKAKKYGPDKIKIARRVVELGHELSPELSRHVEKLAEAIRMANGM